MALYDLRLERLAGLVRVDRLVLGRVILEHAPQIGEQRDQAEIRDEDRDADQALDDHEPAGPLDRKQLGQETRRDLEEHHREADRDREREDQGSTRQLGRDLLVPLLAGLLRRVVRGDRQRAEADRE